MTLKLLLREIADTYVRENFSRILDYARQNRHLDGFKHFEIVAEQAVTNLKIPHNLGFQPKDVLPTWKTGAGDITWNYDQFDRSTLDITTTGPVVVRAFIGAFREEA
jgi:hypothetical protein